MRVCKLAHVCHKGLASNWQHSHTLQKYIIMIRAECS